MMIGNAQKRLKEIPVFNNEDEEREFWGKVESDDYIDWDTAKRVVFSTLKPTPRPERKTDIADKIGAMGGGTCISEAFIN